MQDATVSATPEKLAGGISEEEVMKIAQKRVPGRVTDVAIEKKFGVTVTGISTNIVKGRKARSGVRRVERALPQFKKAIVTLKKGEKIDLFEKNAKTEIFC